MTGTQLPPVLDAPGQWDRYYEVHTGLDAILGTPGLPAAAGSTLDAAGAAFTQRADRGFFLLADQPSLRDPLEVCADLSGAPPAGAFAAVSGPRRRQAHTTATGTHIAVEQLVRGARLIGGGMRVHQDSAGVFAVTGRPVGDIAARDPGPPPPVAGDEALATCTERFELEDDLRTATVDQVVFPEGDGAIWAYEIAFVVPAHAADVRAYLRADDFSVLLAHNISSAARARVYPVNPLQTPELAEVELDGLDAPGTILKGAALDVSQAAAPRLERDDGDFEIDPGEPAFDEVQAYHHLWQALQYFNGLVDAALVSGPPFAPLCALVNDPQSPNNAYYLPTTGELRFGAFGARSSARSASIVGHEFGHAVTDAICRLGRARVRDTESRGLSEGYSDYFVASMLGDPRLGDYVADNPQGARNCSDAQLSFPAGFVGPEHNTGAVWAAVLWGLRGQVGQDTADKLAIESVEFLGPDSTFTEAHEALLAVDHRLFAGTNAAAIDAEFTARVAV